MNSPEIAVIIPAYNEARHIAQVVAAARVYLPVIVVDDGSSDDTAFLAEAAGAEVIRHKRNQGKGAALRSGFRRADECGYQAVITLDADEQHDPNEIGSFITAYQHTQADLIIGWRNFKQMPLSRRLANTSGRWLFSWAMGVPIVDNQSGYRLLSMPFARKLLGCDEQGFEFEVEMLKVCLKESCRLEWIPIRTIYAGQASHIRPLAHVRSFVRLALETHREMRLSR